MTNRVFIHSQPAEETSARYFERVLSRANTLEVIYLDGRPNLRELQPDDIYFFIEPALDWSIGLENAPCITVAYIIDVHLGLDYRIQLAQLFDVVFIAQKDYVEKIGASGHPNVYWLPLACDPDLHFLPGLDRNIDLAFVGQLGHHGSLRREVLTTVLKHYSTNDYLRFHDPKEMGRVYSQSRIVFNASINGDLNMRFFEALASGALLITDRIENGMDDYFKEGQHYVGYSTIEEAIEKINYYLAHPAERQAIAAAGQKEVLQHHTYQHRWAQIIEIITNLETGKMAPARRLTAPQLARVYSDVLVFIRNPWRMGEVITRYGINPRVMRNLLLSAARWLNTRLPMTPRAIRARWSRGVNK